MAEPDTSYSGGPISQHQDQGTHVHNYQQSYDLSSGFNYFPWSPQPYAVASRFEQPQGSSWQRRTHQQPEFQYAGGFSPAAYMGASGAGAQYGPTEVLGNYQSDIGSYPWFDGEHYANGSPNDQNMPRTLHPGMDMPNFAVSPAHSHWVQPPPQYPSRRLSRHVPSSPSPPPTSEMIAAVHDVPNRANSVTTESFPQHGVPFVRRTSYHRPARQGMEDSNSQQRRHMFRPVNGSAPLPELTPLSRNSNRRSFDRYANDLQNEATELARPARSPASRAAAL
ncbi:hypothetical protein BU23DRAFT_249282 [Bimuria novae-zelandiae CBS 107.79]|uniref:Uncharacterized protein n=1 Tax=Bimuria novae-zelandiae CBS 107.79 TaxID=1447943 RepID=A0A6A5VMS5_9PLEO|nr:hypothetical protein BU23DRAFT_249282 [Bimuria novae-zelandiae CBS 107.79]